MGRSCNSGAKKIKEEIERLEDRRRKAVRDIKNIDGYLGWYADDIRESRLKEIELITNRLYELYRKVPKKKSSKKKYRKGPRKDALERAGHECEVCGCQEYLEVHHIVYRSHGGSDELDNLKVLCDVCHMRAHEGEPVHKIMMQRYESRVEMEKDD